MKKRPPRKPGKEFLRLAPYVAFLAVSTVTISVSPAVLFPYSPGEPHRQPAAFTAE